VEFESGSPAAQEGRLAEAAQRFRRALELDPYAVEAWIGLGRVLNELGNVSAALEAFQRAFELDPGPAPL
jgi:Flp pilus assembly protein TadD